MKGEHRVVATHQKVGLRLQPRQTTPPALKKYGNASAKPDRTQAL